MVSFNVRLWLATILLCVAFAWIICRKMGPDMPEVANVPATTARPHPACVFAQNPDVSVRTIQAGSENQLLASFVLTTDPDPTTALGVYSLIVEVSGETDLRNLTMQSGAPEFEGRAIDEDGKKWEFYPTKKHYEGASVVRLDGYGKVAWDCSVGTHTIPLRLTGANIEDRRTQRRVPFGMAINGQSIVVTPHGR